MFAMMQSPICHDPQAAITNISSTIKPVDPPLILKNAISTVELPVAETKTTDSGSKLEYYTDLVSSISVVGS